MASLLSVGRPNREGDVVAAVQGGDARILDSESLVGREGLILSGNHGGFRIDGETVAILAARDREKGPPAHVLDAQEKEIAVIDLDGGDHFKHAYSSEDRELLLKPIPA